MLFGTCEIPIGLKSDLIVAKSGRTMAERQRDFLETIPWCKFLDDRGKLSTDLVDPLYPSFLSAASTELPAVSYAVIEHSLHSLYPPHNKCLDASLQRRRSFESRHQRKSTVFACNKRLTIWMPESLFSSTVLYNNRV